MFLFGYPSLTLVFLVSVPDFLLGEEAGGLGAGVLSLVAGTARFTRDMAQLRAAAVTAAGRRSLYFQNEDTNYRASRITEAASKLVLVETAIKEHRRDFFLR